MTSVRTSLADQWRAVQAELPDGWSSAELRLTLADTAATGRAAALLGPAQPFRPQPNELRFASALGGTAPGPDAIGRLLERVDREGISATLALIAADETAAPTTGEQVSTLSASWAAALATLPPDWSDLYAEVELLSTDYFERACVLCVPLNPRREGRRIAFRFRAARLSGYGASAQMAKRCFERCDAEDLHGSVRVLRVLSDSRHVATQGPVWMLDGRNF